MVLGYLGSVGLGSTVSATDVVEGLGGAGSSLTEGTRGKESG